MGAALVQLFLCLVAGFALWRLWRAFDGEDRFVRSVVFIGFVARAAAGVVLFWISYLRLPVARSLQIGDGLWFFALDARLYLPNASTAAHEGLGAILHYNRGAASVTYVQTLALFALLFGIVASVALLLNLFCYLGSCLILVKLRNASPAARIPGAVAIAAISLSPSAMLWSLQPLKDTLFQFLIIAFVAACVMWQRAWRAQPAPLLILSAAAVMFAAMFAMGGIRWYFAFSVLCATFAFLILTGTLAAGRKAPALVAGAILFATLTQAFVLGAGPYTPPRLLDLFSLSRPGASRLAALSPSEFISDLVNIRGGFERAGGATSIGVGGTLARLEHRQPQPVPQIASAPAQPVTQPQPQTPSPEKTEEPVASTTASEASPPATTESVASTTTTTPHETHAAAPAITHPPAAPATHAAVPAHPTHPVTTTTTTEAPVVAESHTPAPVAPAPSPTDAVTTTMQSDNAATAVAERPSPRPSRKPARSTKKSKARPPVKTVPAPVVVPPPIVVSKVPPAPVPAPVPQTSPERALVLPESTMVRLVTGAVAVLVPRTIASSQGLLDIRGGKGLFWFTDLDTIAFDIVVLIALVFLIRRIRWATLRNPTFWFVGVLVVLVGVPLVYTITNFGTLFRLRMMVYTGAALVPLALAMAAAQRDSVQVEEERPAVEEAVDEPVGVPEALPEPQVSDR